MQNAPPTPVALPPQASSPLVASVSDQLVKVSSASGQALRQAQAAAPGNPLDTLDVPQALAWIDANATDLNSLRAALKAVIALVIVQRADLQHTKSAPLLSPVKLDQE